jgi:hypothetical protein
MDLEDLKAQLHSPADELRRRMFDAPSEQLRRILDTSSVSAQVQNEVTRMQKQVRGAAGASFPSDERRNEMLELTRVQEQVRGAAGAGLLPEVQLYSEAGVAGALKATAVMDICAKMQDSVPGILKQSWPMAAGIAEELRRVEGLRKQQEQFFGRPRVDFGGVATAVGELAKQFRQQQFAMENFGTTVSKRMAEAATSLRRLDISPIAREFQKIGASTASVFDGIGSTLNQFAEMMARYRKEVHPRLLQTLKRRGWVGLGEFTPAQGRYLVTLENEKGGRAVDDYICKMYRRNRHEFIRRAVKKWWKVPYIAKRKRIVLAAVRAHRRGEYALSIPALLPLHDGLSAEIFYASGGQRTGKIVVKQTAETASDRFWGDLMYKVVDSFIYQDFNMKTERKPKRALNRHAVLHGRVINYPTEANSLRVILLLDMLCDVACPRPEP